MLCYKRRRLYNSPCYSSSDQSVLPRSQTPWSCQRICIHVSLLKNSRYYTDIFTHKKSPISKIFTKTKRIKLIIPATIYLSFYHGCFVQAKTSLCLNSKNTLCRDRRGYAFEHDDNFDWPLTYQNIWNEPFEFHSPYIRKYTVGLY